MVGVLVFDDDLMADAAVDGVADELDALRFELGTGGGDVVDVQGDGSSARRELSADLCGVDDLDGQAAGLELTAEIVSVARRARQAEDAAIERFGFLEAGDRQEDEVGF